MEEGIYINIKTFLEINEFTDRDAKVFALALGTFLMGYPEIEVDFSGVDVKENALNLLYDQLSYLFGIKNASVVKCVNTGIAKIQVIPNYTIKPIDTTIC